MKYNQEWYLRRATENDIDELHALCCVPEVYRYLADNELPPRSILEDWVEQSDICFASHGVGVWILEHGVGPLAGCVRLDAEPKSRTAELTYVLHPEYWGQGLATRMSWTVIQHAFDTGKIEEVIAGADKPNTASIAVMRRLEMRFLQDVEYRLGPGVEYVFRKGDRVPSSVPLAISFQ